MEAIVWRAIIYGAIIWLAIVRGAVIHGAIFLGSNVQTPEAVTELFYEKNLKLETLLTYECIKTASARWTIRKHALFWNKTESTFY